MENSTNIILLVFSGTAVMLVLMVSIMLFVVVYNRRLRAKEVEYEINLLNKEAQLLKSVIDTQEEERTKISKNLHDEVGPLISSLKLKITKHERQFAKGNLESQSFIDEKELTDVIMENVRRVSHDLSPLFLKKFGLVAGLKRFFENLDIEEKNVVTNLEGEDFISEQIKLNVYRVTMEVLNNILKHDKPTKLVVEIFKESNFLLLNINHNGPGISNEDFLDKVESGNGLGLDSLRARLMLIGGNITYKTEPAKVELAIPVDNE